MRNFINKLFGKKRSNGKDEILNVLAYAISDAGLWSWYTEKLPDVVQVEFRRTLLYIEPKSPENPPSHQIALHFRRPKAVAVIKEKDCQLADNWFDEFRNDKLEPFNIEPDSCSFNSDMIKSIVSRAGKTEILFGESLDAKNVENAAFKLGFLARGVGMVIAADEMGILTNDGAIAPEQIVDLHEKWWAYWRRYWKVRETDKALPYDDLCEITIPLTPE